MLTADISGFLICVAMYLFLPIVIEFVQVPASDGYGFGASLIVSSLVFLPLSVGTFAASRFLGLYERHFGTRTMIPFGSLIFAVSTLFFALEHGALWEAFVASGLAGLGVGLDLRRHARLHRAGRAPERDRQRHRLLPGAAQHRPVGGERPRRRHPHRPSPIRAAPSRPSGASTPPCSWRRGCVWSLRCQLRAARPDADRRPPATGRATRDGEDLIMEEEAELAGAGVMLAEDRLPLADEVPSP